MLKGNLAKKLSFWIEKLCAEQYIIDTILFIYCIHFGVFFQILFISKTTSLLLTAKIL